MSVNFGYYQSWSIYRQQGCNPVAPSQIDVTGNKYTHLTYTFASINEHFELEPWDGDFDVEISQYRAFNDLKQLYPELRTQIAVGGWTFNDPGLTQTRFSDTARTAANRASFAASCVNFCREYGFDGVDLDWEYPVDAARGGDASDKVNFVLLVEEIRAAFDAAPEDFVLSMAVPAADWRLVEGYDLSALAEGLDFFNVMTYDIHGVWDDPQIIGANTDMPSIFDSLRYFLDNGVQPSKLVLGLAAYGHTYTLADPSCATVGCPFSSAGQGGCAGAPGFMPYFSINKYVESGNYNSLEFNADTGSMELVVNTNELISFDNPATMQLKYDFAAKACFRGLMWWAVDMKEEAIALGPS
jgi:chitinase